MLQDFEGESKKYKNTVQSVLLLRVTTKQIGCNAIYGQVNADCTKRTFLYRVLAIKRLQLQNENSASFQLFITYVLEQQPQDQSQLDHNGYSKRVRLRYGFILQQATRLALDGGGWSTSRPGYFYPRGKTRYPLYRRLGGPQGRSGPVQKIWPPPGFDPRTVQPVGSRYTG